MSNSKTPNKSGAGVAPKAAAATAPTMTARQYSYDSYSEQKLPLLAIGELEVGKYYECALSQKRILVSRIGEDDSGEPFAFGLHYRYSADEFEEISVAENQLRPIS